MNSSINTIRLILKNIKWVLLFSLISTLLLFPVACSKEIKPSSYTEDNVLEIAKKNSPECRIQEIDPSCNCRKDTYTSAEPDYSANYLGDGVWEVNKSCSINTVWDRSWYFYENTGELVIRSLNHDGNKILPGTDNITNPATTIQTDNATGINAPDFTLKDLDGGSVALSDYKGKVVMLDFWSFSCPVCREKIKLIQETVNRLDTKKIAILCINVRGEEPLIRSYALAENLNVPILLDPEGKVSQLYQVTSFPTAFLIDNDGVIRNIDVQFDTYQELMNMINAVE